jgi:hypothetical protein
VPEGKLVERTETVLIGTWNNVVMLLLSGPPTPEQVQRVGDLLADARRDTGLGTGLVHVVRTQGVRPPSEATRQVYRDLMRDPLTPLLASAVVIESAVAFAASLVSSIITGLELVTRHAFPTRMFAKLPAGAAWLAAELDKHDASFGSPDDLVRAFASTFSVSD